MKQYSRQFRLCCNAQHCWSLQPCTPPPSPLRAQLKEPLPQQLTFEPSKFQGSEQEPTEARAKQHEKAARTFNDIWAKGDPSLAAGIMTDDVTIVSWLPLECAHVTCTSARL